MLEDLCCAKTNLAREPSEWPSMAMNRREAVEAIVQFELPTLSSSERESILLDWETIGSDDPGYESLPLELRVVLDSGREQIGPGEPLFDPLIGVALARSYLGVSNLFLAKRLSDFSISAVVAGDVERLFPCPCCHYCCLL
jgi:hypothetical protein